MQTRRECIFAFPMKIKKATDKNSDIDTDLVPAKFFFCHLIKEINIKNMELKNSSCRPFHPKRLISAVMLW